MTCSVKPLAVNISQCTPMPLHLMWNSTFSSHSWSTESFALAQSIIMMTPSVLPSTRLLTRTMLFVMSLPGRILGLVVKSVSILWSLNAFHFLLSQHLWYHLICESYVMLHCIAVVMNERWLMCWVWYECVIMKERRFLWKNQHKREFDYERKMKKWKECCVAFGLCCLRVCACPVHDVGVGMIIETAWECSRLEGRKEREFGKRRKREKWGKKEGKGVDGMCGSFSFLFTVSFTPSFLPLSVHHATTLLLTFTLTHTAHHTTPLHTEMPHNHACVLLCFLFACCCVCVPLSACWFHTQPNNATPWNR